MTTQTLIRLVLGLSYDRGRGPAALRRVWWLYKLIMSGQPASGRTDDMGTRIWTQIRRSLRAAQAAEVVDPRSGALLHHVGLLRPAHGLPRGLRRAVPARISTSRSSAAGTRWDPCRTSSRWPCWPASSPSRSSGCAREPKEYGRRSRFYGSHTGGAWLILFMIFNWSSGRYAIFRGAVGERPRRNFPYGRGAFFSHGMGTLLAPAGSDRQRVDRDRRAAGCTSASCSSSC